MANNPNSNFVFKRQKQPVTFSNRIDLAIVPWIGRAKSLKCIHVWTRKRTAVELQYQGEGSIVLSNSEPLQDPTRAHWSPSGVAVSKSGQLIGPFYILHCVLSWCNFWYCSAAQQRRCQAQRRHRVIFPHLFYPEYSYSAGQPLSTCKEPAVKHGSTSV